MGTRETGGQGELGSKVNGATIAYPGPPVEQMMPMSQLSQFESQARLGEQGDRGGLVYLYNVDYRGPGTSRYTIFPVSPSSPS